jgi:hypothetical protein
MRRFFLIEISANDIYFLHSYLYILKNMKKLFSAEDFCNNKKGFLISSNKDIDCENAFLLTYENHQNIALYTFEKEIYEELRQKNRVIEKEDILNKDLRAEISVLKDLKFLNARFLEFSVKNITDEVWISYYASRHSRFEGNPIAVREYCLNSQGEVVGEKRRHFDSVVFPGQSQNFTFLTFKPVCSKMIFDVVQDGYSGFEPKFEIFLK